MTEGFALEKYIWTLRYEIKYGDVAYNELSCTLQLKKIHEDRIHIIYALQFFLNQKLLSVCFYMIFSNFSKWLDQSPFVIIIRSPMYA